MHKSITLLQEDTQDNEYSKKAIIHTINIRFENRDRLFKRNRLRMNENTEQEVNYAVSYVFSDQNKQETTNPIEQYSNSHFNSETQKVNYRKAHMHQFPYLMAKLKSEETIDKLEGALGLRHLLSGDKPPIKRAIRQGAADQFIRLAQTSECPQLQLEAIHALANISSGTMQDCGYLIDRNCISILARILGEYKMPAMELCIWFFGNIACEFVPYRNMILEEGLMPKLTQILNSFQDKQITEYVAWAISNLSRGSPLPTYEQVGEGVESLCRVLAQGRIAKEEGFAQCCWAISYHSLGNKRLVNLLMQTNLYTKILQILRQKCEMKVLIPCLRLTRNILMQRDPQIVQKMLDFGILDILQRYLYDKKKSVRKQACTQLPLIACHFSHTQTLLRRRPILDRLAKMMQSQVQEIRIEIALFFCQLCQFACFDADIMIIDMGLIPHFMNLLTSKKPQILISMLQALIKPLELSSNKQEQRQTNKNMFALKLLSEGAIASIENLQTHQEDRVYECAMLILKGGYYNLAQQTTVQQIKESAKPKKSKKNNKLKKTKGKIEGKEPLPIKPKQ